MPLLLKSKLASLSLLIGLTFIAVAYAAVHWTARTPAENIIVDSFIKTPNNNQVRVLHALRPEKGVLLFIADTPEPDTITAYAKQFAALSYYVVIVDNASLLNATTNTQCVNIAEQLAEINRQVSAQLLPNNTESPILVGYQASAATVYAALAQANKKTFHAAVGINVIPSLKAHTALCNQAAFTSDANTLIAVNRLANNFYIFQDKNLAPDSALDSTIQTLRDKISNIKFTVANEADQTALSEAVQILQWLDPRLADQLSSDANDSGLPLREVNTTPAQAQITDTMAILLTGDGGWAEIDKEIAQRLAAQGIPTLGFDSLSYFWKARSPLATSQDVEAALVQYLEKWNKKQVILIGYSFGADVLPFIANKLSAPLQQKVSLIALLGMGKTAAFEFRLSSWMNADKSTDRLPILPELANLRWANSICIYGVEDDEANCLPAAHYGVKAISMSGDHHFDDNYDALVQHIIGSQKITP